MNVKIEEVEKNKVKIEIEVGADVLEEGLNTSYKKNAKRFTIPGFRKGRAPRSMVERYYGVEVLYEGAIDAICPDYYDKAVTENNIEPVDSPELDLVELERGKPFIFTATVVVKPEVKLGEYKGIEVPSPPVLVTEDDIEEELKKAADKNARLIPIEDRAAQAGDTLLIDYEGFIDGVPFEGGKGEGYNLEIGSNTFIPGFEDQLIGKLAGDSDKITVRFPEDYQSEELKGREAVFEVTVHSIKMKELPVIDDDFAQDASEFDTLDEYKADIRKNLTEEREDQAKREFENTLIKKIADGAEIDIPDAMIDRQTERNIKEFEMTLAYQGLDLDRYLMLTSSSRDDLENNMHERSESEVRTRLVLEQIAKEESLTDTDEDYENELRKRAEIYKKDYDEYKEQVSDDLAGYIRNKIKTEKIVAFLTENAKRI
ncbi:MAG: trigger factor [Oscillospiraceae bacterium]|nr:trigger factor [Oscillospiraceae bacterium]